jgi:hypothetical protein
MFSVVKCVIAFEPIFLLCIEVAGRPQSTYWGFIGTADSQAIKNSSWVSLFFVAAGSARRQNRISQKINNVAEVPKVPMKIQNNWRTYTQRKRGGSDEGLTSMAVGDGGGAIMRAARNGTSFVRGGV